MKKLFVFLFVISSVSGIFAQSKLADRESNWGFTVSYSQFSNPSTDGEKGFNETVQKRFNSERDGFISKLNDSGVKMYSFKYDLTDTVMYSDNSFISLNCYGGSFFQEIRNISTYSFSINYDLKNNKEILLNDIYSDGYLGILSDYCINELVKQKSEINESIDKNNSMLIECAGPTEKNYRVFNPTKDGLLFSFITYSVNNVMSTPVHSRVIVPYSLLKKYLKQDVKISLFEI